MTNYSDLPNNCRVDFFKECGKWYTTESMHFPSGYWKRDSLGGNPVEAFKLILKNHLNGRLKGMWAVCLEPYFDLQFPLMVKVE